VIQRQLLTLIKASVAYSFTGHKEHVTFHKCHKNCTTMVIPSEGTGFGCRYSLISSKCGGLGAKAIGFFSRGYKLQIKNCGYIQSETAVGKTGCKWKADDT
jgi:hypothetical protein